MITLSEHKQKILESFLLQMPQGDIKEYVLNAISEIIHSTAELTKEAITPERATKENEELDVIPGHNSALDNLEIKWRQFNDR